MDENEKKEYFLHTHEEREIAFSFFGRFPEILFQFIGCYIITNRTSFRGVEA